LNPFVLLFVVLLRKTKGFKQKDSNNKQQNNNLFLKRWLFFICYKSFRINNDIQLPA